MARDNEKYTKLTEKWTPMYLIRKRRLLVRWKYDMLKNFEILRVGARGSRE